MAKSGVKLKPEKVEKLWQMYADGSSIQSISRKFKVSHVTIRKYRDQNGWIERKDKIYKKANVKADKASVNLLAENLKLVRFAKAQIISEIQSAAKIKGARTTKTPYADLDKIVRLEQFLGGGADSRPDVPQPKEELAKLSVEQLIVIHNTLIASNGHRRKPITAVVKKSGGNGDGDN